jgi:hypothetical protein
MCIGASNPHAPMMARLIAADPASGKLADRAKTSIFRA